eukprot:3429640-Prymnesium_polylepis.1
MCLRLTAAAWLGVRPSCVAPWGVAAVRAAARLCASRDVFIGMEPRVAQGLRRGLLTAGGGRWTRRGVHGWRCAGWC